MSAYEDYLKQLMASTPATGQVNPALYAPQRTALENQFSVARGQLQNSLPQGGQLNSALANLIMQRAQSVGGLDAQLIQEQQRRAPQVAQLGMLQEGQDRTRTLQNRNRTAQNWAGLGSGLGILAGLSLGGLQSNKGDSIGGGGLLDLLQGQ